MGKSDEVLEILRSMARTNGKVLSISQIHRTLIKEGVLSSQKAVAGVLRSLEMVRKIRTVDFGVSVELLDNFSEKEKPFEPAHAIAMRQGFPTTLKSWC